MSDHLEYPTKFGVRCRRRLELCDSAGTPRKRMNTLITRLGLVGGILLSSVLVNQPAFSLEITVLDLTPGSDGTVIRVPALFDGRLIFTQSTGTSANDKPGIWYVDGDQIHVVPGTELAYPLRYSTLTEFEDHLYFGMREPNTNERWLWRMNNVLSMERLPGTEGFESENMRAGASHLLIRGYFDPSDRKIFSFDGVSMTSPVPAIYGFVSNLAIDGWNFVNTGSLLSRTNGIATELVATEIADGETMHQGLLYFGRRDPGSFASPWRTDGTLIEPAAPEFPGYVRFLSPTSVGDAIYFYAFSQGTSDSALMKIENGGIELVHADRPDSSCVTKPLIVFQEELFVHADLSTQTGCELAKLTGQGLQLLADLNPGPASSFPNSATLFGQYLLFRARTEEFGYEIWVYDGLDFEMISDMEPGPSSSLSNFLFVQPDGQMIVIGENNEFGSEVWLLGEERPFFLDSFEGN